MESLHSALNLRQNDSDLNVWMLYCRPHAGCEVGEKATFVASPSTQPDPIAFC
jgi:hypothetical protein